MQGDRLPHDQFVQIAAQLSHLIGLSAHYIEQADLRPLPWRYEKELLRESGQMTGRLDARYVGYDLDPLGDSADYDPSDTASSPGFQSGFLTYVRNELNYKSDETYKQINGDVNQNWDYTRKSVFAWLAPTTSPDLQEALTTNPRLRVFVGAGYFDMATPFGAAEWTFSHMGLAPELRAHVTFGYYESGHMVYMNQTRSPNSIATWISSTTRRSGFSARLLHRQERWFLSCRRRVGRRARHCSTDQSR